jgi:hypothetical protein
LLIKTPHFGCDHPKKSNQIPLFTDELPPFLQGRDRPQVLEKLKHYLLGSLLKKVNVNTSAAPSRSLHSPLETLSIPKVILFSD